MCFIDTIVKENFLLVYWSVAFGFWTATVSTLSRSLLLLYHVLVIIVFVCCFFSYFHVHFYHKLENFLLLHIGWIVSSYFLPNLFWMFYQHSPLNHKRNSFSKLYLVNYNISQLRILNIKIDKFIKNEFKYLAELKGEVEILKGLFLPK